LRRFLIFEKTFVPWFFVSKANRQHWSRPAGATYAHPMFFLTIDNPSAKFSQAISSGKATTPLNFSVFSVFSVVKKFGCGRQPTPSLFRAFRG